MHTPSLSAPRVREEPRSPFRRTISSVTLVSNTTLLRKQKIPYPVSDPPPEPLAAFTPLPFGEPPISPPPPRSGLAIRPNPNELPSATF